MNFHNCMPGSGLPPGSANMNSNSTLHFSSPSGSGILAQGNVYQPTTNVLQPALPAQRTARRSSLTTGTPLPLLDLHAHKLPQNHSMGSPMFPCEFRGAVPMDVRCKPENTELPSASNSAASNSATTSALLSLLQMSMANSLPNALPNQSAQLSNQNAQFPNSGGWETGSALSRADSSMSFSRLGSMQGLRRDGSTASLCSGWNQSLNLRAMSPSSAAFSAERTRSGDDGIGQSFGRLGSQAPAPVSSLEAFLPSSFGMIAEEAERKGVFSHSIAHPINQGQANRDLSVPPNSLSWPTFNVAEFNVTGELGKPLHRRKSLESTEKDEKSSSSHGVSPLASAGGRRHSLTEQAESVRQRLPLDGEVDAKADMFAMDNALSANMGSFSVNSNELEVSTNALRRVRKRARCIVKNDWVPRDAKRKTKGTLLLKAQEQAAEALAAGSEAEAGGEAATLAVVAAGGHG